MIDFYIIIGIFLSIITIIGLAVFDWCYEDTEIKKYLLGQKYDKNGFYDEISYNIFGVPIVSVIVTSIWPIIVIVLIVAGIMKGIRMLNQVKNIEIKKEEK